jgi:hypothetical protein
MDNKLSPSRAFQLRKDSILRKLLKLMVEHAIRTPEGYFTLQEQIYIEKLLQEEG